MKKIKQYMDLTSSLCLFCFSMIVLHYGWKNFFVNGPNKSYEPEEDCRQGEFNRNHPVIHQEEAFYNNVSPIKVRRLHIDGCVVEGNLDGYGRSYTYHSYKNCHNCRKAMIQDILKALAIFFKGKKL